MPMGNFENFDACVLHMTSKEGYDEETAKKVCGKIKAESEGKTDSVNRYDMTSIGTPTRTPQGGMVVPANLTRVGIFVYKFPDGSSRKEFRPAEEVFNEDSLKTLRYAPVTDLHPPEMIKPSNYRKYVMGQVKEDVKRADDNMHVEASLMVQDGDTIGKIDRKERKELSCGYACRIDATPGEYNGEKYDVVQRDIRYNHVAIGPANWGRAGNSVALRLDSGDAYQEDGNEPIAIDYTTNVLENKPMKIRFDGKEYEAGSKEHLDAVDAKHAAELATVRGESEALQGRCDALTSDLKKANDKIAELSDPARFDSLVAARVALTTGAGKVLGTAYKFDGKTDQDIMIDVLKKFDSSFDPKDRSADYIRGMYEARINAPRTDDKSITHALTVASTTGAPPVRTEEKTDAANKRTEMVERNRKQASEPLTLSK